MLQELLITTTYEDMTDAQLWSSAKSDKRPLHFLNFWNYLQITALLTVRVRAKFLITKEQSRETRVLSKQFLKIPHLSSENQGTFKDERDWVKLKSPGKFSSPLKSART